MTGNRPESCGIDRAELLYEHPRRRPVHLDLGPERRRPSASRRRSNDDDRPRQELGCLHDDPETVALLLMTDALRKSKAVDVTADHASPPSTPRRRASQPDRPRPLRARRPPPRVRG